MDGHDELLDTLRRTPTPARGLLEARLEPALHALGLSEQTPLERLTSAVSAELDEIRERYGDDPARRAALARRAAWLLRPTRHEELEALDPRRDCNQIVHAISYDFRAELKVLAVNYEMRHMALPSVAAMFASTGEFTRNTVRRFEDTYLLFANLVEWGLDSRRGRRCLATINQIHGRMALPNDGFLFVLTNFMFVPVEWNARFGWRRFTDTERLGWFHQFVEVGRAMNIQHVVDDYDAMKAWWDDANRRLARPSAQCRRVFDAVLDGLLATLPAATRAATRALVVASLDDTFRACTGYPPASRATLAAARAWFSALGRLGARQPRGPWVRTLMDYVSHPHGARVEDLGVRARSPRLPTPATARPSATNAPPPHGHASAASEADATCASATTATEGLQPLESSAALPTDALPELTWDEVRRHATPEDAWLVIDGVVYDVTRFLDEHPGGRVALVKLLGRDATRAFERVGHTDGARIIAANFRIGRVPPADATTRPAPHGRA